MEDVQRNSHAQTRNNATDKINGEENEFQKVEIWKESFFYLPFGYSTWIFLVIQSHIVVDIWWEYIDEHCFE